MFFFVYIIEAMKVIKKLGYRQDFDLDKIRIALQKTARSIGGEFSISDWKELKPRILSRLEPIMKGRDEIYFWEIDDVVIDSLLCSRFKEIAREYIETRSRLKKDKLNDLGLSPVAMWILKERYLRKDDDGKPIETAREMMCRIATEIASVEKTRDLRDYYTKEFSRMLCNLEFLPNSPALVSAGTNKQGTYAACFAFNIEDSLDSIFTVLKDTARTFQLGGGVGINISNLREKGCKIKTSNGESSGPIAFLHLFDTMVETVKAGGFRRGALMAMMRYDHPDIVDFINAKKDTDKLTNMNMSVLLDDKFFESVKRDEDIELISPRYKKYVGRISSNLLLEIISTNIWETGEPGVLFYDRMEEDNPTPHLGKLNIVNPCSESNLLDCESCNLGSINLVRHLKDGEINWEKLAKTTKLAIRFLDNMIDASPYPTKKIEKTVKLTRKVGLGVMGFADMLIHLGIKYSSPEAIETAGKVMSFINDVANQTSIELGREKGVYSAYKDGYRKRRNAIVTTQAPTGSISIIAGVSPGVEPNFASEYVRNIGDERVVMKNPLCKLDAFETTYDIPVEQHLLILAEFQKYVENSISKTINCPEETTVDEIRNLILKAHELRVKGLTIFRQGCRREPLIKCEECRI